MEEGRGSLIIMGYSRQELRAGVAMAATVSKQDFFLKEFFVLFFSVFFFFFLLA